MRDVRHGFGATSYDRRGITSHDGLGGEDDSFEGGGADFVYRGADSRVGHASIDGTLAGRVLAETRYIQYRNLLKRRVRVLAYLAERTLPK